MQRAVPYFADSRASCGGKLPANEFLLKNILWTCLSLLVSRKCAYMKGTPGTRIYLKEFRIIPLRDSPAGTV